MDGKTKDNIKVIIKITRDFYIIDNFKVNIFIGINILG